MDGFNSEMESIRGALEDTLGERFYNISGTDPNRFDLVGSSEKDVLEELVEIVQNVLGLDKTEPEKTLLGRSVKNGSKTISISVNYQTSEL